MSELSVEALQQTLGDIYMSGDRSECSLKHCFFGMAAIVLGGNVPAGDDGRGPVDYGDPTGEGEPLSPENVERWAGVKAWCDEHGADELVGMMPKVQIPGWGTGYDIDYYIDTTKSIWGAN